MLFYDRISKSEGIDLEKNGSKKKERKMSLLVFYRKIFHISAILM